MTQKASEYHNEYSQKATEYGKKASSYGKHVLQEGAETVGDASRQTLKYGGRAIKHGSYLAASGTMHWLRNTRAYRYTKWGLILGTAGRIAYVYGTGFNRTITVSKTFNRLEETQGGIKNEYLVADKDQKLYTVVSSILYFQWFPDELWSMFKEGRTYNITGYGIRIRRFGIHPRIVRATRDLSENPVDSGPTDGLYLSRALDFFHKLFLTSNKPSSNDCNDRNS